MAGLAGLLVAILFLPVARAEVAPLQLSEVLASVERAHPLLLAARIDREAADGEQLAAAGGFDPTWRSRASITPLGYYKNGRVESQVEQPTALWGTSLFAGYKYGEGKFEPYNGGRETNEFGEVRAGVQVPLWRNGPIDRRRANRARAEQGLHVADASVVAQQLELARLAAQRYWDWVAAGERLRVARALLDLARQRDAGLAERVARGDLAAIERTENLRQLVQREARRVAADRSLLQAAIELSLYYRDDSGRPIVVTEERLPPALAEPTKPAVGQDDAAWARELERANRQRPELKRLDAVVRQGEVEVRFARNQRAPALDLVVSAARDLGTGPPERAETEVEGALFVDIPLRLRGPVGRLRVAEAALSKARQQRLFAQDRVAADVRDALSAREAAYQRWLLTRREVQVADQLAEAERTQFENGNSTLLIVNLREQAAADARVSEVDVRAEYHRAHAAYIAAVGGVG
jgi:outer membrane protein TolC